MGGSSSKAQVAPVSDAKPTPAADATPAYVAPAPTGGEGEGIAKGEGVEALRQAVLQKVADEKLLLDAHCHYFNYMQESEGIEALERAMEKGSIGYAVLTGCAFKKTWVGDTGAIESQKPPVHHLYDDGDLYYYSATDGNLWRHLVAHKNKSGVKSIAKFSMIGCGMNLGDYSCGEEAKALLENYPALVGFGEITLQCDDINNVTVKGGNWTYTEPSVKKILAVAAQPPSGGSALPFVFFSDARSVSTKPYRDDFEYISEVEMVLDENKDVKCLWVQSGASTRGQWTGYVELVKKLCAKHKNLFLSFTPEIITGKVMGISREDALQLAEAEETKNRIVLGTTARGLFGATPNEAFGEATYSEQCAALKYFSDQIETRAGKSVALALRYRTAATLYNLDMPNDPNFDATTKSNIERGATLKGLLKKEQSSGTAIKTANNFLYGLTYGGGGGSMATACPPSRTDKKWDTIDCHLHLLDFLQKSSGTSAALLAMDGCDCKKALVFGMPCCKKWMFYRPEKPLYYQDDNAPCYVYAYADQMVADAWLALEDKDRARIAPTFAAFDPTDLAAIDHVTRLYNKYPKMWRGIGEVMCRHDDLTTMLLDKEIPRCNHPALNFIYEFCIEKGLPIQVHHNADRVGDNDNTWEYVYEVEAVLKKYPTLKFVWVHAGVSRRCSEPLHHKMIMDMCTKYDNLMVDISWVVWEDVICDSDGKVKDGWVECIQKHHTKFFIGSDNVAQYFPIMDTSINLLAGNITKYYQLFDKLTPDAAENVARLNAEREYFDTWTVPTGDSTAEGFEQRYARMPSYYQTECLDPKAGKFVLGATAIDDDGLY